MIGNGGFFNVGAVFDRLNSNVHNATDLKNSLLSAYPAQSTAINTLFQTYGY